MIAQPDGGCNLDDPRNWRTRTSIHVEMGGHHIQVDAAPEFGFNASTVVFAR